MRCSAGTTSEEVERLLNMRHQTVSARRTDLRASGYTAYLYDVDGIRVRRQTNSGSSAYVEIATDRGIAAIASGLPLQLNGDDPTRRYHGDNPASGAAYVRTDKHGDARRVLECMCRFSDEGGNRDPG